MRVRRIAGSNETSKKCVAAYARVSTDRTEQETSFDTQVKYYDDLIRRNPTWKYVGIYADNGESGTNADRPEFQRMISDARSDKIDLILVKSISRFSRNVTDAQKYVHELRASGVEVRFDDPSSDMVFSLLSAVAQEESRVISENTKWSYRRNAEKGIRHIGNNRILGYDEVDGVLTPNKDAWIVKLIFEEYCNGSTMSQISAKLASAGAKRLYSDKPFTPDVIGRILDNSTYTGDRIIQKQAPKNLLTKRPDPTVEFEQYYVTDDHEGIIGKGLWEKAQKRREADKAAREEGIHRNTNSHPLYGKVFCGKCGAPYKRRSMKGYDGNPYKLWNCSERQKGKVGNGCRNHGIREDKLMEQIGGDISKVERIEIYPDEVRLITLDTGV